jgi:hypothetical protein
LSDVRKCRKMSESVTECSKQTAPDGSRMLQMHGSRMLRTRGSRRLQNAANARLQNAANTWIQMDPDGCRMLRTQPAAVGHHRMLMATVGCHWVPWATSGHCGPLLSCSVISLHSRISPHAVVGLGMELAHCMRHLPHLYIGAE